MSTSPSTARSSRPGPVRRASGRSAIDGRTTRHPGYAASQGKRRLAEGVFGWTKTIGLVRKTKHRGRRRVGWMFTFGLAVYDLVRMRTLLAASG